jgi:tetratricopeptide (TPR) repeat protein
MDQNNPVIKLCIAGTQAEFDDSMEAACELYQQAWDASRDDYEACIAAHYMARCQETPEKTFRWNREALERAKAINDDSIKDFYPSLYLNMGRSYEQLGNQIEAEKYYNMAAELGANHQIE